MMRVSGADHYGGACNYSSTPERQRQTSATSGNKHTSPNRGSAGQRCKNSSDALSGSI